MSIVARGHQEQLTNAAEILIERVEFALHEFKKAMSDFEPIRASSTVVPPARTSEISPSSVFQATSVIDAEKSFAEPPAPQQRNFNDSLVSAFIGTSEKFSRIAAGGRKP
jgi:hypothetical protein